MSSLDAIGISGSGMNLDQTWLNAISDNLANINDVTTPGTPVFQERLVEASANQGTDGVTTGTSFATSAGQMVYDPDDPHANAQGYVEQPTIDMSTQMSNMIMAQRSYQANSDAVSAARTIYQAALQIGEK